MKPHSHVHPVVAGEKKYITHIYCSVYLPCFSNTFYFKNILLLQPFFKKANTDFHYTLKSTEVVKNECYSCT
uniref:Uncharacterized protein n=1 Tax=Anguilla anguilla TaxID=7936 RepID=A0A0E9X3D3_ANGAN